MIIRRTIQFVSGLVFIPIMLAVANAKGVREHTRLKDNVRVSPSQAHELTLTLVSVEPQTIQTWIRAAAKINDSRNKLHAKICTDQAALIHIGQRVRAYTPGSKSSIYQARISQVKKELACVQIDALVLRKVFGLDKHFVIEIIVNRGKYLSIPNEAIIEEQDHQLVYIKNHAGHYIPRRIKTGIQGELYTRIKQGLNEGDRVVTFGSFFIDADYKLHQSGGSHAHQHH